MLEIVTQVALVTLGVALLVAVVRLVKGPTLPDRVVAMDLIGVTDSAGVGVARLSGELLQRDRWLVVFDNAEDPRAVARFLPEGPARC